MAPIFEESHRFCGLDLRLRFFSARLRDLMTPWFCLPKRQGAPPAAGAVRAEFYEAPEEDLDEVLPRPEKGEALPREGLLLGDEQYPCPTIKGDRGELWRDYQGLGRQRWQPDRGRYWAALTPRALREHPPMLYLMGVLALAPFLRRQGVFALHAACARVGGKGLVFSALSGGGKSTTALGLAAAGHALLSDERVFLRRRAAGGYAAASPSDVVKLNQAALQRHLPQLARQQPLCSHFQDLYFKLSRSGLDFCPQVRVDALCCLEIGGQGRTSWQPWPAARAVASLFPATLPLGDAEATEQVFSFLSGFLNHTPCYRLRLGPDHREVAHTVSDLAATLG